jgi:hypothetical protein
MIGTAPSTRAAAIAEECGGSDNKEAEQQIHPEPLMKLVTCPRTRLRYVW